MLSPLAHKEKSCLINIIGLFSILNLVKFIGSVPARERTTFILLYSTSLRLSNLIVFTINHIRDLLGKGKTFVPLNKGGDPRHALTGHSSFLHYTNAIRKIH
jgi:site-specific recombinase XerC